VDAHGTQSDFIGHSGGDEFIVITTKDHVADIMGSVRGQFDANVGTHYDWQTRQRGYLILTDHEGREREVGLMQLAIGVVTADDGPFTDIREIAVCAASARRVRSAGQRNYCRPCSGSAC